METRSRRRAVLALALAALAGAARAAPATGPGAPAHPPVEAARRAGPIVLDGRLDEAAWGAAPVHDRFFQQFPHEGDPPSERTEVRVLYDDRALWIGVTAFDAHAAEISRPLARRDRAPASDAVAVLIDADRGGRSAYVFELNAAGVQSDGILFEDDAYSSEWDAVWDGAVAELPGGWSAEFRIPLSALRFPDGDGVAFGFAVRRTLARTHETIFSVEIPRSARGQVARLGTLVGLDGIRPVHALDLAPYLASRLSLHPRTTDGVPPRPRRLDAVNELGVDLRSSLGRGLSLQATLNPDFGQVEADEVVQNLSTYEVFFPEKRPFFTQGMDLFQPVAPPGRASPQQLFYSRRIGLDGPILGAAKVSGNASSALQVGLVEAVVAGAGLGVGEDAHPGRIAFQPSQPLWLGPRSALPDLAPAPRNFATGIVRWRPSTQTSLGAAFASAALLGPRCTPAEADLPDAERPKRCDVLAGNAAALDFSTRTRDGEWFALGQATASQALGGRPPQVLLDGTRLAAGDLGAGGHLAAGRQGGEHWRVEGHWQYASPRLDVNATGYQRTQNEQLGRAIVRYVQLHPGGALHQWLAGVGAETRWTTDGRGLDRGVQVFASASAQLRSFHWIGCNAYLDTVRWDVREIQQSGAAYRVPASLGADCWATSDPARAVSLEAWAGGGRTFAEGPLAPITWAGGGGAVVARPHPRLETRLDGKWEWNFWRARWVATDVDPGTGAPRTHWFADLTAPDLSLTLRQQLVITRRVTLQAYAQLFTTYGHYGAFYSAPASVRRVSFSDLVPSARPAQGDAASPEFHSGVLNVNVVLRWEYRTGSTLFAVYTRGQAEPDWSGRGPRGSLAPQELARGPTTDAFQLKWTVYWAG